MQRIILLAFHLILLSVSSNAQQQVTVISRCGGVDTVFIPTITDNDHDRMDDALEQKLIRRFCPKIIQFDDESCPGPALDGTGDSNLVVCHIYPYPQQYCISSSLDSVKTNPTALVPKRGLYPGLMWYNPLIMVHTALLYGKDCGLSGHTADVEGFSYSLKYIGPDTAAGWMYDTVLTHWQGGTIQTVSHASTLCEQIETKPSKVIPPFIANDTVYASPDKHGNYLTISKCGSSFICNPGCGGIPSAKKVKPINIGEPGFALITDLGTVYAAYAGNDPWGTANFLAAQSGSAGAIKDKMIKTLSSDFITGETLVANQICPLYANCYGASGTAYLEYICDGETYPFYSQQLTSSGSYNHVLTNHSGCDSTITVNLVVRPVLSVNNSTQLCSGDSILFGGKYLKVAGVYSDTLSSVTGCDSVMRLQLTVSNVLQTTLTRKICAGDTVYFSGVPRFQSGVFSDTLTASTGCDSVVQLNLLVAPLPNVVWTNLPDTFLSDAAPVSLQGGSPSGGTYSGNGVNAGTFYPGVAGVGSHTFVYTYADSLGCTDTAEQRVVVVLNTGIQNTALEQAIALYPNPAQNSIRFVYPNDVKFIQASIYDSNGKLLLSSAADVISISQLHAGIYAVLLQTNKGEVRKRFAVVK
ncbi:MAG: T9SS type A sorting domain-containing protein [Chitinophagales bacterium]